MWGTTHKTSENETATAAFLDVQPVNDRLNHFADAFEQTEKLMTDIIGHFYIASNYEGCSINYGRRFLVESPDKVWEKYQNAREKGANKITLNYLLKQFYQSEYKNDYENLIVSEKGIKIEPFVHLTDEQVNNLPLTEIDKTGKFYFDEWWKNQKIEDIILKDIEKLKQEFNEFINQKQNERQEAQGVQGIDVEERQA
jgi:hypothetical protein